MYACRCIVNQCTWLEKRKRQKEEKGSGGEAGEEGEQAIAGVAEARLACLLYCLILRPARTTPSGHAPRRSDAPDAARIERRLGRDSPTAAAGRFRA